MTIEMATVMKRLTITSESRPVLPELTWKEGWE